VGETSGSRVLEEGPSGGALASARWLRKALELSVEAIVSFGTGR
jgi:hypothetical protein